MGCITCMLSNNHWTEVAKGWNDGYKYTCICREHGGMIFTKGVSLMLGIVLPRFVMYTHICTDEFGLKIATLQLSVYMYLYKCIFV